MSGALIRYDAARHALAEAVRVDEVKQIRDVAIAAQEYARQAKDRELIDSATEIRERAERRAGQLLRQMEKNKGARGTGSNQHQVRSPDATAPTLAHIGVTKSQSSRWQRKADMSEDAFEQHVGAAKDSAVRSLDRAATQEEKRERRQTRERELAVATEQASAALGTKLYSVIYADPPWRFEPYSNQTGMDRAADNHYPTMTLDGIKALPVPAADDAVLFLWATVPMLPEALAVMAAWGFTYKSNFVWNKNKAGTGYWNRNKHEHLLVGTRGNVPAPAPGEQYSSVIDAALQEHSRKPFHFHEMIEEMFPSLPRIELFAREQFAGWDAWGNQA